MKRRVVYKDFEIIVILLIHYIHTIGSLMFIAYKLFHEYLWLTESLLYILCSYDMHINQRKKKFSKSTNQCPILSSINSNLPLAT